MGHYQSKSIKKALSNTTEVVPPAGFTNDKNAQNQSTKQAAATTASPIPSKALRAAHINTLQAKNWNPNLPESWDAEMRDYHTLENSDYVLPMDAKEQDRLEMQHYIFRAAFNGDIVSPVVKELAKTKSGLKILDVGCARGFWLKCIKKEYPTTECYGVDIAQDLVSEAPDIGAEISFGNVLEGLPYADNTFDYVHQRLLVLGMPKEKFPDAVRELIRVTKPGGWIELLEADVVFYNAGTHTRTLGTALFDALHRRGMDCYAATNLPWYLKQVADNVENQETKLVRIPIGWGSQMGILNGANGKSLMLGMEDWMHKAMGLTRDEYRELVYHCYAEWAENKSFGQWRAVYFQVKK